MGTLAWKNLFSDKVRLAVTLTGIVFALVLILAQAGLLLNFLETSSNIIDHAGADLWITAPHIPHVNGGTPMRDAGRWKALEVPGVQRVEPYILVWVFWKLPTGAMEMLQAVGFQIESGVGRPWNIVAGSIESLKAENAVMVDELYLHKLGISGIGDSVEINGRKAKVVGLTRGIRSFTTAPYAFMNFKNAQQYASYMFGEHDTTFFLVKLMPGADAELVAAGIRSRLPNIDVYTTGQMRWKTQEYWIFQTGAGATTVVGALLGLIVGIVVVAQTIYAATVDHIREFGTLRAMGAKNWTIYRVIFIQATLSAFMGYAIAITLAKLLANYTEGQSVPILLPPELAAGALAIALTMCLSASMLAIRKVTRIDPAMVFRI